MRICDIISPDEYLFSEVNTELTFNKITMDISTAGEEDILIIPNSLKMPVISDQAPPLVTICDTNASLPDFFATIRVRNPRLAMAKAFYRFEQIDLSRVKLIGVTGTNGKSGTSEFIKKVLSECGHKVGFIGTGKIEIDGKIISDKYYSMTTPDPPLLYRSIKEMQLYGCDTIVMEVSSHALALDKLAPLTFDYGILTNLSKEHMDFHINMESYFSEKKKLFSMCHCGVFNIDDEYGKRAYAQAKGRRIAAGILWRGDVWASNIENYGLNGISYIYHQSNFSFKMKLKTAGIYNAYNSMLAAAVCIDMGCKPCDVKQILGNIDCISGRFEIINDKVSVIIDYAHTDIAFNNIMKELSAIKGDKYLSVVFGCGGDRDKEKRPKMAKIAERYANSVFVTTDNSRSEDARNIIADITRGFEGGRYQVIENRKDAIRTAILTANDGDIIAIIGKGCEGYFIDKEGYHDYNEKEIIRNALSERRVFSK